METSIENVDWKVGRGKVKGLWLGHASFLMAMPRAGGGDDLGVLFDPVFEERCSPSTWVGPIRDVDAPCLIPELPVSFVLVVSRSSSRLVV